MNPDRVADFIFDRAKHQTNITEEDITIMNHNGEESQNSR